MAKTTMINTNEIIVRIHISIANVPAIIIATSKLSITKVNELSKYELTYDILQILNAQLLSKYVYLGLDYLQEINEQPIIYLNKFMSNITLYAIIDTENYAKTAPCFNQLFSFTLEKYSNIKFNTKFNIQKTQVHISNESLIYNDMNRCQYLKVTIQTTKVTIRILLARDLVHNIINTLLKANINSYNVFNGHEYYKLLTEYFLHNLLTNHISPESTIVNITPIYAKIKDMVKFHISTKNDNTETMLGNFYISSKSLIAKSIIHNTLQHNNISAIHVPLLIGNVSLTTTQISSITRNNIILLDHFMSTSENINKVFLQNGTKQNIINITTNDNEICLQLIK